MTVALSGKDAAAKLEAKFPGAVVESSAANVVVKSEALLAVATFLKHEPGLEFNFLSSITAVDYGEYFELVYNLTSLDLNQGLVLKTRCHGREKPAAPSVVGVWKGADFQEREIFDLMGITFEGHPNLRRIVMWDGYQGHPQRKDYWQWQS